ncbi:sugar ABC transporter permease [Sinorhizobium sp. NFACC03]|uniref:carbohydrate ABC transporter permease n=1 Tax=Sinorhizobium sp. NFACC03 TaxID=1566295 RepID=UPI00087ED649|nr:sugar ABC transporter permease [Sinorhizobium sp. NFACC03]SDA61899.1 multiple sugar transport system permease protein [Sinorhizobium sp. NFACC03]
MSISEHTTATPTLAFGQRGLLSRFGPSNRTIFPWVLMAPTLIILFALGVYPFLYSLYIASHNVILSKPYIPQFFVGLYQYQAVVQDPEFWHAMRKTLFFTVQAVFIEFWMGLGLALLFQRQLRGVAYMRIFILIPMILPPLVAALIWRYMFYPGAGLMTYYIGGITRALGLGEIPFLSDPVIAFQTLVFVDVWEWTPFMFLMLSAGLASIPRQPYEAAEIDGAGSWRVFWTITMPLLRPAILIAVIIRTMDAFRTYELIVIMTRGGPGNATTTLNVYLTKTGLEFFDASKAAALSLIMMMIIIVMSFVFIRVFRSKTEVAE